MYVIDWYHSNLCHPRVMCTLKSINQIFYWKGIRGQVKEYVKTCDKCQHHKIVGKPIYGILPLTPALCDKDPFEKVHVDCAGPWTVRIDDRPMTRKLEYQIYIFTMLDAAPIGKNLPLFPQQLQKL